MKKIITIFIILFAISLFAEDEPNNRSILHGVVGFASGSVGHIVLSNIEFTQDHTEEWNFYLTGTAIVIEELYSNNWNGVKFWKLAPALVGFSTSINLWKGTRPVVYPAYNTKTKAIGLDFALSF